MEQRETRLSLSVQLVSIEDMLLNLMVSTRVEGGIMGLLVCEELVVIFMYKYL